MEYRALGTPNKSLPSLGRTVVVSHRVFFFGVVELLPLDSLEKL